MSDLREEDGRREGSMSKYDLLWKYIQADGRSSFRLTFAEIEQIAGVSLDHSFLTYKKELAEYGYRVGRIARKEQAVVFERME